MEWPCGYEAPSYCRTKTLCRTCMQEFLAPHICRSRNGWDDDNEFQFCVTQGYSVHTGLRSLDSFTEADTAKDVGGFAER